MAIRTPEEARAWRAKLNSVTDTLDDTTALSNVDLYTVWMAGIACAGGDRRRYNGNLYRCVQAHTSQSAWTPDVTPALWTAISLDDWPQWVQPTGAQDAYNTGDRVTFDGARYICMMDANAYSPAVYPAGWEVQS